MPAFLVDLDAEPNDVEMRLIRDDCIISIWLPAPLTPVAEAMQALADIGFEFWGKT